MQGFKMTRINEVLSSMAMACAVAAPRTSA